MQLTRVIIFKSVVKKGGIEAKNVSYGRQFSAKIRS